MSLLEDRVKSLSIEQRKLLKIFQEARHVPASIPRMKRDGCLPLSYAQERMWVLDQLTPGNPTYNLPRLLSLLGPLVIHALERSMNEIILRHEVLRAWFENRNGEPRQVFLQEVHFSLQPEDLAKNGAEFLSRVKCLA